MYECGSAFICIAILGEILLEGLLDWSVGGIIQKKLADSRFGLKPRWFILVVTGGNSLSDTGRLLRLSGIRAPWQQFFRIL